MKESGKKKTKILKIILIAILCYILFAVLCFGVVFISCNCANTDRIKESGFFKYTIVDEEEIAIVGFTGIGLGEQSIEIPQEIDGKPVVYIGYRDYSHFSMMPADYYRLESYNLKKLYIHDNIKSIEKEAFLNLSEIDIMVCSDSCDMSFEGVMPTNRVFVYKSLYDNSDFPSEFFPANIVFMNNYSDEVNGGYYRLDNVEEDEKIPEPPDPEREGYEFTGWYTEPECENLWSFNETPAIEEGEEFRLYAGWHML